MTASMSAHAPSLIVQHVLRRLLLLWFALLVGGAFTLGVAFVLVTGSDQPNNAMPNDPYFIVSALMLGLVVPLCLAAHWTLFRKYWKNGFVQPRGYVAAYLTLWTGLMLTILTVAFGIVQRNTIMPDLTLAAPAMVLMMISWPNGWAMTHKTEYKYEDDDEVAHLQDD